MGPQAAFIQIQHMCEVPESQASGGTERSLRDKIRQRGGESLRIEGNKQKMGVEMQSLLEICSFYVLVGKQLKLRPPQKSDNIVIIKG